MLDHEFLECVKIAISGLMKLTADKEPTCALSAVNSWPQNMPSFHAVASVT